VTPAAPGTRVAGFRLRETLAWRPEWPIALLVALAWVLMLAGIGATDGHGDAVLTVDHAHHGQGHGQPSTAGPTPLDGLPGWALMSIAMMVPVTLPAVRHVGVNSLRIRRLRGMATYTAGYVAVWVAFGAVVLGALALLRSNLVVNERLLLVGALVVAAAWQLTPHKRRALFACRRTVPLPPIGRRADVACARYAVQQGMRCVISCWPLMTVMAVVGHANLIWMVVLTALIVAEELPLVGWRLSTPAAVGLALAAGLVAIVP